MWHCCIVIKPTLWVIGVLVIINQLCPESANKRAIIYSYFVIISIKQRWIDTFGSRAAKSAGSSVHMLHPVLQSTFCNGKFIGVIRVVWCLDSGGFVCSSHVHDQALKEDRLVC